MYADVYLSSKCSSEHLKLRQRYSNEKAENLSGLVIMLNGSECIPGIVLDLNS